MTLMEKKFKFERKNLEAVFFLSDALRRQAQLSWRRHLPV